jgi:hypothetical protein
MRWTPLPDTGLEVRTDSEGSFWRHDPPSASCTDEGVGPYATPDDAARDGADYAQFAAGD